MKYDTGRQRNREKDSFSTRTWKRLTLKHPSSGQTGSVCNSLSTKTHSVYLGQQEEGPREEKSKSQYRPSLAPQLYIQLHTILSPQHFQLSFWKAALNCTEVYCLTLIFLTQSKTMLHSFVIAYFHTLLTPTHSPRLPCTFFSLLSLCKVFSFFYCSSLLPQVCILS